MTAASICRRDVPLTRPEESVRAVAQRLAADRGSEAVVVSPELRPIGLVSEGLLVAQVLAKRLDPARLRVADVMQPATSLISAHTPLEDVLLALHSASAACLPVVDEGGRLLGLVRLEDVLGRMTEELLASSD